jgi:two-component system KDP operon response regulator KdpE
MTIRRGLVRHEPTQRQRKQRLSLKAIELGDRTVILSARVVRGSFGDVRLTHFECCILRDLLAHVNRTVPSAKLVHRLWPSDPTKGVHSLRAFIKNLRKKIEPDPPRPQHIITDLAVGYRLQLSAPAKDR